MKILFAASEKTWGGFLSMLRSKLPEHEVDAAGGFHIDTLAGYDILIPTMSPVTADAMDTADRLKLIQQCGAGLEGVDIPAAAERNIGVANVPTDISGNADSVAELGIYMMVGLARDFRAMEKSLKSPAVGSPFGRALKGKTVGFVGLGGIARALIERLRPFGMKMVGIKRRDPEAARLELDLEWTGRTADLPELMGRSDFVMLCLPLTEESEGMIDAGAIAAMKRSGFLINLSRGGIVDKAVLLAALEEGRIAGAGLDVFWEEPPDPNDPIFEQNVLATPHVGGATDISADGILAAVVENIRRVERGETPLYLKMA